MSVPYHGDQRCDAAKLGAAMSGDDLAREVKRVLAQARACLDNNPGQGLAMIRADAAILLDAAARLAEAEGVIHEVVSCFEAAMAEGLQERINESEYIETSLSGLFVRRIGPANDAARDYEERHAARASRERRGE